MQLLLFLSPCLNYSNGSEQPIEQQASSSINGHIVQISRESMKQNKDVDRAQSDDMAILQVQHWRWILHDIYNLKLASSGFLFIQFVFTKTTFIVISFLNRHWTTKWLIFSHFYSVMSYISNQNITYVVICLINVFGKKKVASYESIHETKPNVNLLVISLLICIWIVPCVLFESWDIYVKLKIDIFVNYILFYHITFFICLNKLSTWTYMWLLYDIPLKLLCALLYTLRIVFPIYVVLYETFLRICILCLMFFHKFASHQL